MTLLKTENLNAPETGSSTILNAPVFRLGFRPFYLLAAAFAVLSVPVWMMRYFGWAGHPVNAGVTWHMHEMIFGFVIAVIIGFLYTAGRNWTGLPTPARGHLAALAGVWAIGRIAMLAADPLSSAFADLLFLPLATWPLYCVLKKSGNKRNMFLVGLLILLMMANAAFHGAVLGWFTISPVKPIHAALMIIVMLESVIAGRVIPVFTANVIGGAKPVTDIRRDQITIALTALACLAWIIDLPPPITASLAVAVACAQLFRLAGWRPFAVLNYPLLWILHVSYAWIPLGFILIALSVFDLVPGSAAVHLFAIGATSGLIIGMITRTTLGHTGRPLKAGKGEVTMYLLIQAGTLCRFVAAVQSGAPRNAALLATSAAWISAFLIYLFVYSPYLTSPRFDGKEEG